MRVFLSLAVALIAAAPAFAADPLPAEVPVPVSVEARDFVIDLGLGVALSPRFPSSKEYIAVPFPIFALRFLRLPVVGEVVTGKQTALSIYPSFGFAGERSEDDADYLEGVPDVDLSVELGAGVSYRYGFVQGFVQARYGVIGHNGIVGEAGIDLIYDRINRLELRAGPRVSAANGEYMDAYFSVPNATAMLDAFDADAGIKDVGIAANAVYELTDKWRLYGRARYTHFVGDALDSPIVDEGNDQEFSVGVGISYRFGLDLY